MLAADCKIDCKAPRRSLIGGRLEAKDQGTVSVLRGRSPDRSANLRFQKESLWLMNMLGSFVCVWYWGWNLGTHRCLGRVSTTELHPHTPPAPHWGILQKCSTTLSHTPAPHWGILGRALPLSHALVPHWVTLDRVFTLLCVSQA